MLGWPCLRSWLFDRFDGRYSELPGSAPSRALRQYQAGDAQDGAGVFAGRAEHVDRLVSLVAGDDEPVVVGQDDAGLVQDGQRRPRSCQAWLAVTGSPASRAAFCRRRRAARTGSVSRAATMSRPSATSMIFSHGGIPVEAAALLVTGWG